ncbi:hypothetical protein F183_A21450 [Bryobacterales bacterium F-183]|nr:hypothetical protein F183_A21450 [Bryobacterales bacterium F-183]
MRGYVMELQADYLAGWYLQKRFGSYQDVESVLRSFYSIGNTDFTDSSSHPSPEMRVKAVLKGYQTGATDVQRAVRESLAYVTNEGTKVDDEGTISMTLSALGNDIRKAIAAADQYFASWKGENLETRWSSRVVLTGARDCSITDNTEDGERYASLRCRMQISEQQADHESAFAAYKKQISQALVGARFEDNSDGDAARWISESGLVSIRLRITRERVRRGDRTEGSLFSGSMITLDVSRFQTRQ